MKTFLHLEFGQLSQLLGSIEDELSALEETERGGRGEGEREGGEVEGGGEGVVIVEVIVGSSKRLSVTQRTPTSLTLPFINTHSKPLYGCHCTFFSPFKSATIALICNHFILPKHYTHKQSETFS